MGYRSDVRIVTSKRGYKELINFISSFYKKNNIENNNQYRLLKHLDVKHENKFQKYFGWNNISWYNDVEIKAIEEGLQYLKDNDYSYRFAKLGERYDDYEEHYHESSIEKEQGLEFPSLERYFDDSYALEILKKQDKQCKEIERE